MTRSLPLCLVFACAIGATAQQAATPAPPEGSNWRQVEALPAGASLNVRTRRHNTRCKLKSVDDDSLTCSEAKELVLQRADILSIKIPRRGRSNLIGLAIGGGAGVIAGAAAGCSSAQKNSAWGCFVIPTRTQGAAILGVLFGGIGAGIGAATDFSRSTVYTAP